MSSNGFDTDTEVSNVCVTMFHSTWCANCKAFEPAFNKIVKQFEDTVKFSKIDVSNDEKTTKKYNLLSLPTIIVYKNGEEQERFEGSIAPKVLKQTIEGLL